MMRKITMAMAAMTVMTAGAVSAGSMYESKDTYGFVYANPVPGEDYVPPQYPNPIASSFAKCTYKISCEGGPTTPPKCEGSIQCVFNVANSNQPADLLFSPFIEPSPRNPKPWDFSWSVNKAADQVWNWGQDIIGSNGRRPNTPQPRPRGG